MTVHDYSNFGLFWTHPEGCEHITTPRASCLTAWRVNHADDAPPVVIEDTQLTDLERQMECAPYPGVYWSTSKQRYTVQLWLAGKKRSCGSFTTLAAALEGHDAVVLEHDLPRRLYTRKDKSA